MKRDEAEDDDGELGRAARRARTEPDGRLAAAVELAIDTGTDAMAAVFASIDAAATSIGFPIRNMHTISECGHTGDVLAAIHATVELLKRMDALNGGAGLKADDLREGHPRLDRAGPLDYRPAESED